ncbi:MAG: stage II sporulation protein D [Bacilli bacterium]
MKKIIVLFILVVILLYSYKDKQIINNKNDLIKQDINIDFEDKNTQIIKLQYNNRVIDLELEDYVVGVVACEMPASFELDALKSLSVAARTFALYKLSKNENYIMKSGTSDQCYISTSTMKKNWGSKYEENYNKIKTAVDSTSGEYLTYKDEVIISFYFSISNGYTENCENVFSQKLDYLKSVDSSWDKKYGYKEKEVKFTIKDFLNKLGINGNIISNIDINRSQTGRVNEITINNKSFKGTKFRTLLSLRSTDIEISYDKEYVYITTKGYGHGVGMSQYGANAMASEGYKYDEILKYYYTGVKIMNN